MDESLFLQSPKEAGRRSRPPTPELRCPRGLPGPPQLELRPTPRNRRGFPWASQANPSNLPARLDFSCLSLQGPGKIKGTQEGREDYTRQGAGGVEGNGIREGSDRFCEAPATSLGHILAST